jgi:predicted hydrolase (HD superfamily)
MDFYVDGFKDYYDCYLINSNKSTIVIELDYFQKKYKKHYF